MEHVLIRLEFVVQFCDRKWRRFSTNKLRKLKMETNVHEVSCSGPKFFSVTYDARKIVMVSDEHLRNWHHATLLRMSSCRIRIFADDWADVPAEI